MGMILIFKIKLLFHFKLKNPNRSNRKLQSDIDFEFKITALVAL